MAKGMDTRLVWCGLIQSTPKIKAFYVGIMEKTFLFVCWIMTLFSLHTLKKCFEKCALLSFLKKKINGRFLSLQKSVNEELVLKSCKSKFEVTKISTNSHFKG